MRFAILTPRATALALATVLMLATAPPLSAAPARDEAYRLGYGDAVTVTIVGQPTLSVENQPIRPDGEISLPYVRGVKVQGKTVAEATQALAKAYQPYLSSAQVVMYVVKFRPVRVTVLGQVARPGTFGFENAPTLADALATAGGLTDRAVRHEVRVVDATGAVTTYDFDAVSAGKVVYPRLAEGSVVEVKETWTPDLVRFVPAIAALLTVTAVFLR